MIDISTERLLTLKQASTMLPGRPSHCALWRWRTKGVRGRKLECITVAGRVYTSVEALQRFAQAGAIEQPQSRSPAAREKAIARAERKLAEAGI